MLKKVSLVLSASALLLFSACKSGGPSGDAYDIKFNPETGKAWHLVTSVKSETEVMGQKVETTMEMRTSMESLGKEGDNQKIRTSFEHIKMDMPAMRMHYETGKSEPGSPMAILDSMSNMKMVMFMDKQMKVTKFEFEGANIEALKDQFDNMKQNLNSGMAILPDHPVKKGESWNADIEVSSGVKMKMHTKYTLKDVKDGRAVLEVDGKMEIPSQDNKGMNMSGDGTIKGSSEVDMKTGMTLKSDLVQDMNMKTNVMGKDMSMKIKNSIGVFEAK